MNLVLNSLLQLVVCQLESKRNDDVKDQLRALFPGNDPEVVHGQVRRDALQNLVEVIPQCDDVRVVCDNRIHMDCHQAVKLRFQVFLGFIDDLVKFHDVSACRDLGMEGDDPLPGSVIIDNQIVDACNLVALVRHDIPDLLYKCRIWCLPEKRVKVSLADPMPW